MKNYKYIQSPLGFGIIKILFFLLTLLSLVGCQKGEVVSEKRVESIKIVDKKDNKPILPIISTIDKNITVPKIKEKEKTKILLEDSVDKNITPPKIKQKKVDIKETIITDPLYKDQWYLHSKYGINLSSIWSEYSGKGISIGVVDSGIEALHPDLKNSVDLIRSFRYEDNSSDPSPTPKELKAPFIDVPHGTAVAGIIGATHNDIGIGGIAYESNLIGLNVFSKPDDSSFENAIGYKDIDISSNSWGADLSFGLDDDKIVLDSIEEKMQNDPTIYIFASGNEQSNSDFSSVLNSRYTLVIGGLRENGVVASYSNYGSNILCVAPSGEDSDNKKIVTTDLMGDLFGYDIEGEHFDNLENKNYEYSNSFYGTSASVPMVSGVVALMLEANSNLDYRDVKYIIAHSCRKIDINNSSWIKNGGSLWVSNYYGFGLIDAKKAVEMSKDFSSLSSEIVVTKDLLDLNLSIPDNDINGTELFFDVVDDFKIEYVSLEVNTNHVYSGDLKITLKSPQNIVSTLAEGKTITEDPYMPWEFGSITFMDEFSKGRWSVNISDLEEDDTGVLNSLKLTIYGHKK